MEKDRGIVSEIFVYGYELQDDMDSICRVLNCQPGDLFEYTEDDNVQN